MNDLVKGKKKILTMNISYPKFALHKFSFAVLLSAVSLPFASQILAQMKQRREQQQQKLEARISALEYLIEEDITGEQTEEVISELHQILQTTQKLANPEFTLSLLNRIINTYDIQDWLLGRLINRVKPHQKQQATKLLMLVVRLTQSVNQGYNFEKTIILTKIANYSQRIGEQKLSLQLLTTALKTSQLIPVAEFQAKALLPIAQAYLGFQQTTQAEEILSTALQIARQIESEDPTAQSIPLEAIALTYIKLGKIDIALEIAASISYLYYRSHVISEVVRYFVKTNQLEAALKLAQKLEISEMKSARLREIALIYVDQGEQELANQVFATALTAFTTAEEDAKGIFIQSYAKAGQLDAAYLAVSQLKNSEVLALTLGIIAIEYLKFGKIEMAEEIIPQIIPLIQTVEAVEPMGSVPSILSNALETQQYKLAFDIILNANHSNFLNKAIWILQIGNAAIQAGEIEITLKFAQSLEPSNIEQRNQLLQKIALIYAQNQQIENALALVPQIDNSGSLPYQIETLVLIATANGKTESTEQLFTQAIAAARKLAPQSQVLALAIIAREYLHIGNQQLADALLAEAIQLAKTEQDAAVRESNLLKIEELLMTAKQYLAALQVMQAHPTEIQDNKLNGLALSLVETGYEQIDVVNKIYQQIKTPEIKTTGLINIAETYIHAQKIRLASEILDFAFAAAKTIPGPESRVLEFGSLPDGSPSTIIEDEQDRGSSLEKIALLKALIGYYQQALKIAQILENKITREKLIRKLAEYKR